MNGPLRFALGPSSWLRVRWLSLALATSFLPGCGTESGEADRFNESGVTSLTPRRSAVVVEGCSLDSWQRSTLQSEATRKVIQEVILLCLLATDQADVTPGPMVSRSDLDSQVESLQQLGYSVSLAMTLSNESGAQRDPARASALLADETWRADLRKALLTYRADGLDIALPQLSNSARPDLVRLIDELSLAKPAPKLGVFAPPSSTDPSDLPGGDAYDIGHISASVDLPNASKLQASGIRQVIYVVEDLDETACEEDDLHEVMLSYQQAGIAIFLVDLAWLSGLRTALWADALASLRMQVTPRKTLADDPAFYSRSRGGFGGLHSRPSPIRLGAILRSGGHVGG